MDEETARIKMENVANVLDEEFPDCRFVIIALTNNQTETRYLSNVSKDDAEEMMEELIDSFEEERLHGNPLH